MKSNYKTGILTVLLIIPVFVFLFLKIFGKNFYHLPVYYPADSVFHEGKYKVTQAHSIPAFTLTTSEGGILTRGDLQGKIFVADFFFTRCPGICLKMTNQLVRVQEEFSAKKEIKIVSFTVDPAYDTPEVLKAYAQRYNADPEIWQFLTGEKDYIYQLAMKGFFLSAMEDEENPLDFIHSEKLVLVDRRGWIRGYYDGTDQEDVDRLITEIKVLLNEDSDK